MEQTTKSSPPPYEAADAAPSLATKARNFLVVGVAVILSVLVVMGVRTQTPAASLETLAAESTPLEAALANGKPSLMEFYANWCTSCQAMANDMAALRSSYSDDINFVMLNVDNNKWLPEMLHYRVDGIPHFVYLNAQGEPITAAIGEQPKAVIASNLDALTTGAVLPYQQGTGQTSNLDEPTTRSVVINSINRSDDPRSHGAQAAN